MAEAAPVAGMVDCKGKPVEVGADVVFRASREWRRGTVRAVTEQRYSRVRGGPIVRWEACVDDGDAHDPDLASNRFTVTVWVKSSQIQVRPARPIAWPE